MATKKEGTRNDKLWTEARYTSFVKGGLRSISQRWPPRYSVLNQACIGQQINTKSGRLAKHYLCASCNIAYPAKEVEVNHRNPIVPVTGFDSWDGLIERLFCEKEHLEVLCKPCHRSVSKLENQQRKEIKDAK